MLNKNMFVRMYSRKALLNHMRGDRLLIDHQIIKKKNIYENDDIL